MEVVVYLIIALSRWVALPSVIAANPNLFATGQASSRPMPRSSSHRMSDWQKKPDLLPFVLFLRPKSKTLLFWIIVAAMSSFWTRSVGMMLEWAELAEKKRGIDSCYELDHNENKKRGSNLIERSWRWLWDSSIKIWKQNEWKKIPENTLLDFNVCWPHLSRLNWWLDGDGKLNTDFLPKLRIRATFFIEKKDKYTQSLCSHRYDGMALTPPENKEMWMDGE